MLRRGATHTAVVPRISPLWHDASFALPDFGPQNQRVDTLIVGAGLTGLSTAFHLLERCPGRSVLVIDADQLGAGASARSSGMLTPGVGQDLTSLVARLGPACAKALYEESLRAVRRVESLVRRENIACELHMGGQLVVAAGPRGQARLARLASTLQALDLPYEPMDSAALDGRLRLRPLSSSRLLAPAPSRDHHASLPYALRLPIAGTLHPGHLLAGLAASVERRGGRILGRACVSAITNDGPVVVQLEHGPEIVADRVVLATNGYSGHLTRQVGRVLPLHLRMIVTEPLSKSALAQLGWGNREGVIDSRRLFNYFRLSSDNRLVFGGGRPRYDWGGAATERDAGAHASALVRDMYRMLPLSHSVDVAGTWTGVIGYTLDALPVFGPTHNAAVIYAGGYCGHGIALSVACGEWLAARIAERSHDASWPAPGFSQIRKRAPWVPTELARWFGVRAVSLALSALDEI
jgi:gamma-glutamylputrescine oxidase